MELGYLRALPRSVAEVIDGTEAPDQIVGVHGVLYSGPEYADSDLVVLPKSGWFDGLGVENLQMVERSRAIRIDEPGLAQRLAQNVSVACGGFRHKYDCIVVGRIRHERASPYGAHISDLVLLLFQGWRQMSSKQQLYFLLFPSNPTPLPWASAAMAHGVPLTEMIPVNVTK